MPQLTPWQRAGHLAAILAVLAGDFAILQTVSGGLRWALLVLWTLVVVAVEGVVLWRWAQGHDAT